MSSIKYNIRLNVYTLKSIFKYFDMNEDNTIIMIKTRNSKVLDNLSEFKSNIIKTEVIKNEIIVYFKNLKFEKLIHFFSKYMIFNVYYFKVNDKFNIESINKKLKNNINKNCSVIVHVRLDTVYEICFDEKIYNLNETKFFLKKYKTINIEYVVLFILLIVGILIRIFK